MFVRCSGHSNTLIYTHIYIIFKQFCFFFSRSSIFYLYEELFERKWTRLRNKFNRRKKMIIARCNRHENKNQPINYYEFVFFFLHLNQKLFEIRICYWIRNYEYTICILNACLFKWEKRKLIFEIKKKKKKSSVLQPNRISFNWPD